jgi:hypothetical protein
MAERAVGRLTNTACLDDAAAAESSLCVAAAAAGRFVLLLKAVAVFCWGHGQVPVSSERGMVVQSLSEQRCCVIANGFVLFFFVACILN